MHEATLSAEAPPLVPSPHMTSRRIVPVLLMLLPIVGCGGDDAATTLADDETEVSLEPIAEATTTSTTPVPRPDVEPPATTPTELIITDLSDGTGWTAGTGDIVWVDYTGILSSDGTMFDNSYDRGEPIAFTVGAGAVIDGWDQGLIGARAGMQRRLDIPGDLAYGDNPPAGSGIGPGDALTFMLEVRAVVPPSVAEDAPDVDPIEFPVGDALGIDELTPGNGHVLAEGDVGIAHVIIANGIDGTVAFDTWAEGQPLLIDMEPGFTIDGLYEGMLDMAVGSLRVLTVPSEAAFGADGLTDIGIDPDTPIVLIVELVGAY